MKKILAMMTLLAVAMTGNALAMKGMDHGSGGHGGDKSGHEAMMSEGGMMMLESDTVEGVTAKIHLKDVRKEMKEAGLDYTHHIMVMFESEETEETIEEGKAAVKITTPEEVERDPVMMMAMEGHFGADIKLEGEGLYHFKIGTKLKDGNKRTFHTHAVVE